MKDKNGIDREIWKLIKILGKLNLFRCVGFYYCVVFGLVEFLWNVFSVWFLELFNFIFVYLLILWYMVFEIF